MDNILIKVFKSTDINSEYISMLNYKDNKYSRHQNKIYDNKSCMEFLKERNLNNDRFLIYKDKNSKNLIGTTCGYRLNSNIYNLGIMLHFNSRGKGLGKIIWLEAIKDLFKIGAIEIYAGTNLKNKSMLRILNETMVKININDHTENAQYKLLK